MATSATSPMSLKHAHDAREAVEVYVKAELAREQFTQEADKAWLHYQETGLHATNEEIIAWIDSWGLSSEAPKPKCHA